MSHHVGEVWIRSEHDIPLAREWILKLTRLARLSIGNQARLSTTVAQVVQCLFHYCQSVHISFDVVEKEGVCWLQVTISEQESVDNNGTLRPFKLSRDDLFRWLEGLHLFVRAYSVSVDEKQRIKVIAAKPFPPWQKSVSEATIEEWANNLHTESPISALEAILRENRELVEVLDDLREKEAALEQKIAEIEKLEQMRDDLIHALIHDLRNPLASIRSSLSGLLYNAPENLTEYQKTMLDISYDGAKKMSDLVDNILDVHKLDRDEPIIEPVMFSMCALIEDVVQSQKPLWEEKKIEMAMKIPDDLPEVEGDKNLVERLLQNLLDNAIKFTPENGNVTVSAVKLWVGKQASGRGENTPALIIRIADSGPGITDSIKDHLFEKFKKGSSEASGSGIGLAFCKLAVRAHGGEIWVENSPDQGATFAFLLPLTQTQKVENRENGRENTPD